MAQVKSTHPWELVAANGTVFPPGVWVEVSDEMAEALGRQGFDVKADAPANDEKAGQ